MLLRERDRKKRECLWSYRLFVCSRLEMSARNERERKKAAKTKLRRECGNGGSGKKGDRIKLAEVEGEKVFFFCERKRAGVG